MRTNIFTLSLTNYFSKFFWELSGEVAWKFWGVNWVNITVTLFGLLEVLFKNILIIK